MADSNGENSHENISINNKYEGGRSRYRQHRVDLGLNPTVLPKLLDDDGNVTKDGISHIKSFAECIHSMPDRTTSKWHAGINCMQEELNRQVFLHDLPAKKGFMLGLHSIKQMQDEIKKKAASS